MTSLPEDYLKTDDEPVECFCPKCLQAHIKHFYYTGKLPAKVFCKSCKMIIAGVAEFEESTFKLPLKESHGNKTI